MLSVGSALCVIKNISGITAGMPDKCDQIIRLINCVPIGSDDGNLSGDEFLAGWVAATVKSLR